MGRRVRAVPVVPVDERDIEGLLRREVEKLGGRCVKWGVNGEPDRMVLLPGGSVVFVETKREDGELSALQQEKIRRLRKLGFEVYVPYSKDEVRRLVDELRGRLEERRSDR